jgi:outer membrane beta-barrel protein
MGLPDAKASDVEPSELRGKTQQTPVTVLQNRYFLKALRPELGLAFGTVTNEAYTDTRLSGYRVGLFINEWIGIEGQSFKATVSDSDDRKALNQLTYKNTVGDTVKVDPEVNRIKSVSDASLVTVPFYGKLNFADWLIIYSDVAFNLGISKVATDQGDLSALTWGVGQRFYWQKSLSLRVDFRDRTYTEIRNNVDYRKHTYSVDFGLSYFFF